MFPFASKALVLALLMAASGLALAALSSKAGCTRAAGLDVWNIQQLEESLDESRAREREMNAKEQQMWQRAAERRLITTRLLERELTLADAVDKLLALSEKHPEWFESCRPVLGSYLGVMAASDREFAAHLLLFWIWNSLDDALILGEEARAALIRERLPELGFQAKSEWGASIWRPFPGLVSASGAPTQGERGAAGPKESDPSRFRP